MPRSRSRPPNNLSLWISELTAILKVASAPITDELALDLHPTQKVQKNFEIKLEGMGRSLGRKL